MLNLSCYVVPTTQHQQVQLSPSWWQYSQHLIQTNCSSRKQVADQSFVRTVKSKKFPKLKMAKNGMSTVTSNLPPPSSSSFVYTTTTRKGTRIKGFFSFFNMQLGTQQGRKDCLLSSANLLSCSCDDFVVTFSLHFQKVLRFSQMFCLSIIVFKRLLYPSVYVQEAS